MTEQTLSNLPIETADKMTIKSKTFFILSKKWDCFSKFKYYLKILLFTIPC